MSVLMAYHTKTLHAKKQLVNAINTLNKAQCQLVTSLESHMNVLCALELTELWKISLLFDLNYKYINGSLAFSFSPG